MNPLNPCIKNEGVVWVKEGSVFRMKGGCYMKEQQQQTK